MRQWTNEQPCVCVYLSIVKCRNVDVCAGPSVCLWFFGECAILSSFRNTFGLMNIRNWKKKKNEIQFSTRDHKTIKYDFIFFTFHVCRFLRLCCCCRHMKPYGMNNSIYILHYVIPIKYIYIRLRLYSMFRKLRVNIDCVWLLSDERLWWLLFYSFLHRRMYA